MTRRRKNSRDTDKILHVDPRRPKREDILAAVRILERQGIVVIPTAGLYGLAADASSAEAVRRIFAIKRRPPQKPLPVLLSDPMQISLVVRTVPDHAKPLMGLWPGGITLIFEAIDGLPDELTGRTGKIGVRILGHPVARAVATRFGGPITGTSANLSGEPAVADAANLEPEIQSGVDLVLDVGRLSGKGGSTIVDVTRWPIRLLREGRVPLRVIESVLKDGP